MARGFSSAWLLLLAMACAHAPEQRVESSPPAARPVPPEAPPAVAPQVASAAIDPDALLARMSLEEKVGQLMMVGFAGKTVDESITRLVRGHHVGGVCVFNRNVASSAQVAKLNDDVRALLADSIPPFIAVDQEGGNVVRVSDGNLVLPGNMVLGAARDPELAYQAGLAQGEDLKRLGFNMNLAPVLDVNSNPHNPIIGLRAFGDDVELVALLGASFVRGQQAARMVTVAKHFPGHGSVQEDSHKALPVVRASEETVRAQLKPFAAAMEAGLDGLMTAHVATPALSGDETPATLSPQVLSGVLRDELKFDGLVITDELEMEAIAATWGVGPAAVLAVNAGSDMVLVPWRLEKKEEVYAALLEAARSGDLPQARLNEAVRRVLTVKLKRGVFEAPPPLEERLASLGEKRALAGRIAAAGLTLLRSTPALFPVGEHQKVAVISPEASLCEAMSRRFPGALTMTVSAYPSPESREGLKKQARALASRADVVVVGVSNSRQLELVTNAALSGTPVIAVVLGAPYLAGQAHQAKVVLATYSVREEATEAAAAALAGEQGTPGKLPVTLPRLKFGYGLNVAARH